MPVAAASSSRRSSPSGAQPSPSSISDCGRPAIAGSVQWPSAITLSIADSSSSSPGRQRSAWIASNRRCAAFSMGLYRLRLSVLSEKPRPAATTFMIDGRMPSPITSRHAAAMAAAEPTFWRRRSEKRDAGPSRPAASLDGAGRVMLFRLSRRFAPVDRPDFPSCGGGSHRSRTPVPIRQASNSRPRTRASVDQAGA